MIVLPLVAILCLSAGTIFLLVLHLVVDFWQLFAFSLHIFLLDLRLFVVDFCVTASVWHFFIFILCLIVIALCLSWTISISLCLICIFVLSFSNVYIVNRNVFVFPWTFCVTEFLRHVFEFIKCLTVVVLCLFLAFLQLLYCSWKLSENCVGTLITLIIKMSES